MVQRYDHTALTEPLALYLWGMIRSMTGYGKAEGVVGKHKYTIEVRSLNSKQFDLNARIPSMFREKEMGLRKLLRSRIVRGKCDFFLFYELDPLEVKHELNGPLVENYISQLSKIADSSGANSSDLLALAVKMPDVMQSPREELDAKFWVAIEKLVVDALDRFDGFRETEGATIESDFEAGIEEIRSQSVNLDPLLEARHNRIRTRIKTNLEEVIEHYNSGGNYSSTVDPLMKKLGIGLQLTNQEKKDLVAYLKTLSDYNFINK